MGLVNRTQEQVDADEALTMAIERVRQAYQGDGPPGYLDEYIVVYTCMSTDEEGDLITPVGYHPREGLMPLHREMGLLTYVLTVMKGHIQHH